MNSTSTDSPMQTTVTEHSRLRWEACQDVRRWYVFIATSVTCFLGGILVILCYRLMVYCIKQVSKHIGITRRTTTRSLSWSSGKPQRPISTATNVTDPETPTSYDIVPPKTKSPPLSWLEIRRKTSAFRNSARMLAVYLVSYHWCPGRVFIALTMILSLCSFGIYAFEATVWPGEVEKCGHKGRRIRSVDFCLNVFFLIHFIVRLTAAQDALVFWVEWFAIIDYLTVPPILLGYFMKRTWLGFRFARAYRLTNLSEVLHNLHLIKSDSSLRFCHFCTLFLFIWFSGAGMFLLLENTGDLFGPNAYNVTQPISYPNALYFTMVTMSTVGYGDITAQTQLGRIFVSFFILVALATFASAIPVIVETFFSVRKYSGWYVKPQGKSHIVVCGEITTDSIKTFLSNFLHEDRERSDVEVVFINPNLPDLHLQSILRRHFARIKYFQGTVMDHVDLQRVRMDEADACLILASSTARDADQKDAANIMRVIAVKNYASHVRVIVQLLQTSNKAHLFNSPYWNWDAGDEIICFNELKLGFLAQSCVAPGFSTLLTNLFSMHSQRDLKQAKQLHDNMHRKLSLLQSQSREKSVYTPDRNQHAPVERKKPSCSTFFEKCFGKNASQDNITNALSTDKQFLGRKMLNSEYAATLLTNQSPKPAETFLDRNWFACYLHGLSMEIYAARLSRSFEGLSFTDAVVICRKKLDLLLIAIVATTMPQKLTASRSCVFQSDDARLIEEQNDHESTDVEEDTDCGEQVIAQQYLAINPAMEVDMRISHRTLAFFICDSQNNADRATFYCATCHATEEPLDPVLVGPCGCGQRYGTSRIAQTKMLGRCLDGRSRSRRAKWYQSTPVENDAVIKMTENIAATVSTSFDPKISLSSRQIPDENSDTPQMDHSSSALSIPANVSLDVTGMYHYCEARSFEDSLLLRGSKQMSGGRRTKKLMNHILLCLITDEKSPPLGLHSFVMPLRASNIHTSEIKPIVILANESYLRREWSELENFPEVYCLPGSPLSRMNLRTARIRFCSHCVVLGASGHAPTDDTYLLDKEVILCSLNIRSMRFAPLPPQSKYAKAFYRRFGFEVPLITELVIDANIHYLDLDAMEPGSKGIPPALTAPFARGIAFTSSLLNVLVSTAYFDRNAMTLIRHLLSGVGSPALEQWMVEGGMLNAHDKWVEDETESDHEIRERAVNRWLRRLQSQLGSTEVRRRPRVTQLSIMHPLLLPTMYVSTKCAFSTFGDLFCHAVEQSGILCLGIYRNRHITEGDFDLNVAGRTETSFCRSPTCAEQNESPGMKQLVQASIYTQLSTCTQPIDRTPRRCSRQMDQDVCNAVHTESTPALFHEVGHSSDHCPISVVNRYVVTNPPNLFRLYRSDLIFCLCPFRLRTP